MTTTTAPFNWGVDTWKLPEGQLSDNYFNDAHNASMDWNSKLHDELQALRDSKQEELTNNINWNAWNDAPSDDLFTWRYETEEENLARTEGLTQDELRDTFAGWDGRIHELTAKGQSIRDAAEGEDERINNLYDSQIAALEEQIELSQQNMAAMHAAEDAWRENPQTIEAEQSQLHDVGAGGLMPDGTTGHDFVNNPVSIQPIANDDVGDSPSVGLPGGSDFYDRQTGPIYDGYGNVTGFNHGYGDTETFPEPIPVDDYKGPGHGMGDDEVSIQPIDSLTPEDLQREGEFLTESGRYQNRLENIWGFNQKHIEDNFPSIARFFGQPQAPTIEDTLKYLDASGAYERGEFPAGDNQYITSERYLAGDTGDTQTELDAANKLIDQYRGYTGPGGIAKPEDQERVLKAQGKGNFWNSEMFINPEHKGIGSHVSNFFNTIRDTITPSAVEYGGNIIKSAFQGGDPVYRTDFKESDIRSLFERSAQIPWTIGNPTRFSDKEVYENEQGELVPHTDETRKEFPNNAISQTTKAWMDPDGNVNLHDDTSWVNNPLAQIVYGYQNPVGARGASLIEYNQPSMFHSPTAEFSDAAYLNLKSDDPNETTGLQGFLGRALDKASDNWGLSRLWYKEPTSELGKNENIVGTEFGRASLPYSQWSDKMKIQSGVPDFKQAMQMRRHIDINTGKDKKRLKINPGPPTGTGRTPFQPNPKQYTRTY